MHRILVSDVMTREPISAPPNISILEATKILVKKKVGSILLIKDEKLVGILSQQDILWALIKKSPKEIEKIKAIEISPKKIATIRPDAPIEEAIKKMKHYKFERLPVIKEGKLLGLITTKDILNFNPNIYPEFEEFEGIREISQKLKRIKEIKERKYKLEGTTYESETYNPWEQEEEE
jgi:acetoin utilization protein AcuB